MLVALSWLIDWRRLLAVVKPDTLIRWHRTGFRLLWRWKSRRRGRPRLPADLRRLIAEMALANRTWGERRIAAELLLKLGIHGSPRTVRCYRATRGAPRGGARSQLRSTFVRNHASAVLACDFFVVVTATLRVFYVFVVLEVGSRRIRHNDSLGAKLHFDTRKNPRIQMADLVAREAMKELDRKVGPVKRQPRKSFLALEQSGKFKFQERDRAYCERWREMMPQLSAETGMTDEGCGKWLFETGRVHKGKPHDTMANRIEYFALLDRKRKR